MAGAAWEQGVPPVGTSVADQNPDFLEALFAYRRGVNERSLPKDPDGKAMPEPPRDADPLAQLDEIQRAQEAQAAPVKIARATGRRRKPK